MKKTARFYESGHAFFGREVTRRGGYVGDLDTIANAVTITVIKPNTSLEDVKRSLQITIQDINLRMKQEASNPSPQVPVKPVSPLSQESLLVIELRKAGEDI